MTIRALLVSAGLLAILASCARAEPPENKVARALKLTYVPWPRTLGEVRTGESAKAATEFSSALSVAGSEITAQDRDGVRSRESDSITAKLAAIALDRAERPERYEELEQTYVRPRKIPTVSGAPSQLKPEHVREEYRLPWEYLLLSPWPDDAAPGYWQRASTAVGRIGDPRSVVTLLHAIRVGLGAGSEVTTFTSCTTCRLALTALAQLAVPEAVDAVDEAFPASAASNGPDAARRDEALKYLVERIRTLPPEKRAAWRRLVQQGESSDRSEMRRLAHDLRSRLESSQ